MKQRFAFLILAIIFLPLNAQAQDTPAAAHKWKMATSWPGGVFLEDAKIFARHVNFMTDGRVHIDVFPGDALGNPTKVSETVKNGVAEIGHTAITFDYGKDKTATLFLSWGGGPWSESYIHWLYEAGGLELYQQFRLEKFGLIGFPAAIYPAEILHSKKPIHTLADMKGLKLRTVGAWLEISQELGAAPVSSSGQELYQMLERGTIDAAEWGMASVNLPMGFHQAAHYIIVPGIHQPANMFEVIINQDAWNSLSERDQKMIALAAKLTSYETWTKTGFRDIAAMQAFAEYGNEIIVLDDDSIAQAHKIAQDWADQEATQNPWFAKVWEHQKAFMKEWQTVDVMRSAP